MKVFLAGFNVDITILRELEKKVGVQVDLTPEVISAAYARISRDPRPINEIRQDARREVERARKSNRTIIFKMGHHSIAEHAVFNLDIMDISRLAVEELEKFRLSSYTEKSQRYITLDKAFVIPKEIKNSSLEKVFVDMVEEQMQAYHKFFLRLKEFVFQKYSYLAKEERNHSILEGWAKEDARYITPLATKSQVGQTVNARSLELILRRFASHSLQEIQDLGRAIYDQIVSVAPSIVIFHSANERDSKTYPELKKRVEKIIAGRDYSFPSKEIELVEFTPEGDKVIAGALLHTSSFLSYQRCRNVVNELSYEELQEIFKCACQYMEFYDPVPREFEYASLTFNLIVSAACFGQLKRHRLTTITTQPYEPQLGVTIPESIKEIGEEKYFREIIYKTNKVYTLIKKEVPLVASYILTNAHRRRVLIRINARELYHISRLREDRHAQWDIRNISSAMSKEAKRVMPLTFALLGGKDEYNEIYRGVYGHLPKVREAKLPGVRKIR